MKFWEKGRIRPRIKSVLLTMYNAFWEAILFLEKQYLRVYCMCCPLNPHKVVFSNFFGRPYGGNPKYIAEELIKRCPQWDIVWLLADMNSPLPQGVRPVRFGSSQAIKEMASAKFLIVNVRNIPRPLKKKRQILLQTWHGGMGFKLVEGGVTYLSPRYIKLAKRDGKDSDAIISSCAMVSDIYRKDFWLNEKTEILEIGLPRNDMLLDSEAVRRATEEVRSYFRIEPLKKILLYMPTFRDDGSAEGYALDCLSILRAFEKRFGAEFVLLIRLHPNAQEWADSLQYNENILNANTYPDTQELCMAADFLITDYSSVVFDYALLGRPAFLCALDYEEYKSTRGLTDMFEKCPFDRSFSNAELIEHIHNFSLEAYEERMKRFMDVYEPFDHGDAAKRTVDWLLSK